MTPQEAYGKLTTEMKRISTIASSMSVLHWDLETYMPPAGSAHRGEQMSAISGLVHEMFIAPEVGEWISAVEGSGLVTDPLSDAAVNVRELRRQYDRATKIPTTLVEEFSRVTARAHHEWLEARAESDFSKFQSSLARIIELNREQAACIDPHADAYDTLMDDYEPGMTSAEMSGVFAKLAEELPDLVEEIVSSDTQPDGSIFDRPYDLPSQKTFAHVLSSVIGLDLNGATIHTTVHPFCSCPGPGDVRVNTRYNHNDVSDMVFSVLHEDGHAIYDQGLDPAHYGLPRGEAVSLGIHESQSRMWENFVGRSHAFWEYMLPIARGIFPEALRGVSVDEFYFVANKVDRGFIRVEADEVTYNLHVLLRFEMEQRIIRGDIAVADIPGAWNARFKELLHVEVPNDTKGCLQDVHWSGGSFGYFPTYTLGNLYSAQIYNTAGKELGDLDAQFRVGDFTTLREWLNKKVHTHGMRYRASDLVKEITGEPLTHTYLMDHLKGKLGPLYKL